MKSRTAPFLLLATIALVGGSPALNAGVLVGQCIEYQPCWESTVPWSYTLTSANLTSLGLGSSQPLVAEQTSEYIVQLGVTTIVFNTPEGQVTQTLPQFSGPASHGDPCNACEIDTVGNFTIPPDATSATISGTFGNSESGSSAGVNVYFGPGIGNATISAITNSADSSMPPLAPGSLAIIYGTNLASSTATAPTGSAPFTLGGATITVNGTAAAILYASPSQINFQIPYETAAGTATVIVTNNGAASNSFQFSVIPAAPGVFAALTQNSDSSTNSQSNPAAPGSQMIAILTGVGAVSPAVADGAAAPASPPSMAVASSGVTVGGAAASVSFLGLEPGTVGMAQANITVPASLLAGSYPLVVTVNGVSSAPATVYVSGPAPTVSSVNPNTVPAYSLATPVTIAGSNFGGGSVVLFTPPGGTTTSITPSQIQAAQITATIPPVLLISAGTAQVAVQNGLGTSTTQLPFTISPAVASTVSSVTPNSIQQYSPATAVSIAGSNFGYQSVVSFTPPGGTAMILTPSQVQAAQIAATIAPVLLTSAGTAQIAIQNGAGTLSNQVPLTITPAVMTTTALTVSGTSPSIFGQSLTLVATVSPSAATGSVTFYNGTTVLGTAALSNGSAALTTTLLASGAGSLRANYLGGAGYAPSNSAALPQTINSNPSGTLTQVAGSPIAVGTGPDAVAVGDFNGDGIQDLALANGSGNSVTVLLGNGLGGFSAAPGSPFAVGMGPASIAVGDFNGDGVQDLAVANSAGNNLTILLGNVSGGFSAAPGSPFAVGLLPISIAAADFNGDGFPDLAVANQGSNNVTVLLGNVSGSFSAAPGSPFAVGLLPISIAAADFNGDGIPDLAVANQGSNNVTVLLGNGTGGFSAAPNSPFATGTGPQAIVAKDLNGDGFPDIATANNIGNNVTVLLGNGSGGFNGASGSLFSTGTGPLSIAAEDVNGDGIQDLAVGIQGSVEILLGNGSGAFSASGSPFPTGTNLIAVVVGDFNGDGRADLAVANQLDNNVAILLGGSAATGSGLSTTSPAIVPPGAAVPLTLTVSDTGSAFNSPTGTVMFYDGTTPLGTATQTASPYTFTATGLVVGSHTFTATYPGDTRTLGSSSNPLSVAVGAPVSITTSSLPSGIPGQPYGPIQFTATGGIGAYTWSIASQSPGLSLQLSATGLLTGSLPTTAGTYTLTVTVHDTFGLAATQSYILFVNSPPLTLTGGAAPSGMVGQPYSFSPTASGGSGNFTWSASGVPGLQINSQSGNVSGPPTTPGTFTLSVTVTDVTTALTASASYSVVIAPIGLSITTTSLPNGAVGASYPAITLAATGGFGTNTWSATGAPPGITVSSAGVVSGTPTSGGTFAAFTVTVTDTTSKQTATKTYSISIASAPLTITSSGNLGGFVPGAAVSASFASNGGNPPYTWSASGLPSSLTLTASSGALAGTAPQTSGNYSFTITVMDSQSPASSASLTGSYSVFGFTTASPLPAGSTTAAYSANILATGGTPPYTFSATGLPAGLSLASSGFLSGTPAAAGSFSLAITVTDSMGLSTSGTFALTISATAQPVQVSGASLPDGTVTTSYSQTLEADGGKPPYTWSIIGGSLPAGLALSGAGTISGTPVATGLATFTARATDTAGGFASAAFTIMVDPNSIHLSSLVLPNGIAGSTYPPQTVAATGGMPPYTSFLITSGSLPPGISFSNDLTAGQVSGLPTSAGSYGFTITTTDQAGNTASGSYSLVIQPAHADLILAQGSVSFALATGGATVPSGSSASISVLSSSTSFQQISYAVTPSAVPWLDVSGGPTTPAAVAISLDPSAVNLAPGSYQTSVAVTCQAPSPCKGSMQSVAVSLVVTSPAPQLSLSTGLLSFSATGLTPQTLTQPVGLQDTGGGTITINSASAADPWVTLSGVPSTITAGQSIPVTVTVNTGGLAAGYYQSTITITSSAGSASLPVTLLLSSSPTLTLNPAGSQFLTVAGSAPGNTNGSFLVSVSGSSTINWTASVPAVANASVQPSAWLTLNTPGGSSTSASPGAISFSLSPSALAAGTYYATIRVTEASSDANPAIDTPQDYLVVLNIAPTSISTLNPSPGGLIFIAAPGVPPPPQTVQVFASTSNAAPISYLATPSTFSGGSWLSASSTTGMTNPITAGVSNISVAPGSLAPGVYRGTVAYQLQSGGAAPAVNVTLVVQNASGNAAPSNRISISAASAFCTPTQIIPTQTGLTSNFAQPTSWPTPLTIKLLDDCANAVPNGQVIATFTNGDPPLILQAVDTVTGTYSGTWTPHSTAPQVTIAARATAPSFSAATLTISGQVTPVVAPVLSPNGTVNIFVPVAGSPLAPGLIVQIYGLNMAGQPMPSSSVPLTTSLGNTSVLIGGVQAPLYYVSPTQINAQVPFELTVGKPYQVLIDANGALSSPGGIQVGPDDPGIASFASGQIIAQHAATGALVTDANPAAPGEYVVFYVAGMGLTTQTVGSGQPSPSNPAAMTLDQPTLTLNGQNVPIAFAGLTPTYVGLYQVNFQIPANTPNGDLQLVLTQSGGQSNQTVLAVHN